MPSNMKPHSRDLRKGRHSERGRIYHVRTSTENKLRLFTDLYLGWIVVNTMRFLHDSGDVQSLAFVVMPDHLHWLFQLSGERPLDKVLYSLKSHSAGVINQRLGQVGVTVWQDGYFDRAIREDEDVIAVARYIVANPLRAGLCQHIADYSLWDAVWLKDGQGL